MRAKKIWRLIGRIYDDIESALWALLITSVIFFIVFVVPKIPEISANIANIRAEEIAVENANYCEKLGMKAGTQAYSRCLLTLGDFRLKVEQRIGEENDF
jgi:hypothetical protein